MNEEILRQFERLYNYQSTLAKLTNKGLSDLYNVSELHCLEIIAQKQQINGKELAIIMKMTKGAISKISKKLLNDELIEGFNIEGNKKEKYFKLTTKGIEVNERHEAVHQAWKVRDSSFLETVGIKDRETVYKFLTTFNGYLEKLIEEEEV